MEELTEIVLDFVEGLGACDAGIATIETLLGGPPTADLTYVLPNAKSAICFAVSFDQSLIPHFLGKQDRLAHEKDNFRVNSLATGIAQRLADYLEQTGHPSVSVSANDVYRSDVSLDAFDLASMYPPLAHRYLAVRSGVGWFGMSGNLITKSAGAGVILASVVTSAELIPSDPLPQSENYCDNCGLCAASCASGFFEPEEKDHVILGGVEFSYSKRLDYSRCGYICGGYSGLHPSEKWSTWSPGRFPIPDNDNELTDAALKAMVLHDKWPKVAGGFYHCLTPAKVWLTCGNCQLVCVPEKEERERRYRILVDGGVVVQNPDGSLEGVSPEKARSRLASMSPEERALYEEA